MNFEPLNILEHNLDLISENEILSNLQTNFIGQNIFYYPETSSTNIQAKQHSDAADGSIFITELQTGGKGRLGRNWISPTGVGLWFSILLKPNLPPPSVPMITLVAGLSVCRVIQKLGFDAKIKWPNDIVIGNKKVCGILTEMSANINTVNYIVCGIGINVNNDIFSDELQNKATSLMLESGTKFNRCKLLCSVLYEFELLYNTFLTDGFALFKDEYTTNCITLNRTVSVIQNNQNIIAQAVDITDDGSLVVETDEERMVIASGEVSVRGLYGYI